MRTVLFALAALAGLIGVAQAQDARGVWHGGHELVDVGEGVQFRANVIHLPGGKTGFVDLTVYAGPDARCSDAVSAALCQDLKRAADERGFIDATVTGARVVRQIDGLQLDDFLIAFRLPGDESDRLLVLEELETERGAALYHPARGEDYQGLIRLTPHPCDRSGCADDVFRELRDDPDAQFGSLYGVGWTWGMRERTPGDDPVSSTDGLNGAGPDGRRLLSDAWSLVDETGTRLGTIRIEPGPDGVIASGVTTGFFETGAPHETVFTTLHQTDEAVAFGLTVHAGESGERREGQLVVELPAVAEGHPQGTLLLSGEVILVSLIPEADDGGPDGDIGGDNPDFVEEDEPPFDLPAIGLYRYDYRLRNVPAGRELTLRRDPSREAEWVGQLASDARPFTILNCEPYIAADVFHDAPRAEQRALLSTAWCEVMTERGRGWVPGVYLDPVEPPE